MTTVWPVIVAGVSATAGCAAAAAAFLSFRASRLSAETARSARLGQLFDLARDAHQTLTTGEVAAARDRLGTLSRLSTTSGEPLVAAVRRLLADDESTGGAAMAGKTPEAYARERRRDWFTLLWSLQRVHAVREILDRQRGAHPEPADFLDRLVTPIISFLNDESESTRRNLEELLEEWVDDQDSKEAGFIPLVEKLVSGHKVPRLHGEVGRPRTSWRRWALPVTTAPGADRHETLLKNLGQKERDVQDRAESAAVRSTSAQPRS